MPERDGPALTGLRVRSVESTRTPMISASAGVTAACDEA